MFLDDFAGLKILFKGVFSPGLAIGVKCGSVVWFCFLNGEQELETPFQACFCSHQRSSQHLRRN